MRWVGVLQGRMAPREVRGSVESWGPSMRKWDLGFRSGDLERDFTGYHNDNMSVADIFFCTCSALSLVGVCFDKTSSHYVL